MCKNMDTTKLVESKKKDWIVYTNKEGVKWLLSKRDTHYPQIYNNFINYFF